MRFAKEVEPDNAALQIRIANEQSKREQNIPTVPSNIGLEKQTNPFMRARENQVIQRLLDAGKLTQQRDAVSSFAALREWKNNYR